MKTFLFLFQLIQYLKSVVLVQLFAQDIGLFFNPVATLLASLTLFQVSTAWVHIVMMHPVPGVSHFRRLPHSKRAFDATWWAILLHALEFVRLNLALKLAIASFDRIRV